MISYLQLVYIITLLPPILFSVTLSETPNLCTVVQGLPGLNGRDGRDGVNGMKGEPGPLGEQGLRGIAGPPGKVGPMGNQGDQGNNGIPGPLGQKGDKGDFGLPGVKGNSGEKGQKGDPDTSVTSKDSDLENRIALLEKQLISLGKVLSFASILRTTGDKYYATKGDEGDYSAAQTACERQGGTLPTPMNNAEDLVIYQFAHSAKRQIFLGINDIKEDTVFTYLNGKQLTYTNWYPTEPNGGRIENCVETYHHERKWNDRSCDAKNLIVCEF
ncbi:pulmonary surfactant-associated protein A [Bombina bombina]|uniref:pulmonary surfactant-associated protein A n=1 Tax=Bombina bombina TaxID=8345 RepID=UPI00235AB63F|nr:pulmonary surfactant-associated protein A [Bombina bombina]